MKKKYIGMEKKQARWGFLFVLPAILFFSIFSFYPILNALYTSFFDKRVLSLKAPKFIGIDNYLRLFTNANSNFYNSLRATSIFTLGTFIPLLVFSLLFAALIMILTNEKAKGFFQIAFYTPAVVSSVVAAVIWMQIFDPAGLANQWLNLLLGKTGIDYKWMSDATMVQISTMIVYFWKYIGYFIILFITGMSTIPPTLYEAARIDGSSNIKTFFFITLPLLKPTILLVSIMAMLQCLKTFSTQYLFVQNGSPQAPIEVITLNIYETGISNQRIGRASAMSIVLFIIMLVFTYIQFRISKTDEINY